MAFDELRGHSLHDPDANIDPLAPGVKDIIALGQGVGQGIGEFGKPGLLILPSCVGREDDNQYRSCFDCLDGLVAWFFAGISQGDDGTGIANLIFHVPGR